MITVHAPGKLFIAGEYAVVEAGQPAVLVAVDRYVAVTLSPAQDTGKIRSDQYGRLPVAWRRFGDKLVLDTDQRPFDYILAAIDAVESYALERGLPLGYYDLDIASELDDDSGRKFGLGSSAAVTVATVRALDRFYDLGLSHPELLKLALLATLVVNPNGSGGDIASSMYGGWIAYRAFDRDWARRERERTGLVELLAAEWPGLAVRHITPPAALRLVVGWTGVPASTMSLVRTVQDRKGTEHSHYAEFLDDSRACVEGLIDAFENDDAHEASTRLRTARGLLNTLSAASGLTIETPALTQLCDSAERHGAAAKSSGAGGGDCGIVLAPRDRDIRGMIAEWERSDIRHLTLDAHVAEVGAAPIPGV